LSDTLVKPAVGGETLFVIGEELQSGKKVISVRLFDPQFKTYFPNYILQSHSALKDVVRKVCFELRVE